MLDVPAPRVRAAPNGTRQWTAEQGLLIALLEDAARDILLPCIARDVRKRCEHCVTGKWLSGAPATMPFADCCDHLGLDVCATRTALLTGKRFLFTTPPVRKIVRDE